MPTPTSPAETIEVFFSYSHRDEDLRDALADHLSILKRQGVITDWYDREITAGTEWEGEISKRLESADIILLLLSANFIASDYCYDVELRRAMERHEAGEARVIPVILRPVDWRIAFFEKLRPLPKHGEPITSKRWDSQDEALLDVARGIRLVAEQLRQESGHKTKEKTQNQERLISQVVPTSVAASDRLEAAGNQVDARVTTETIDHPRNLTPARPTWTRRRLIQYAGLGGAGVAGALVFNQVVKDRSPSPKPTQAATSPTTPPTRPPLENLTFDVQTVDATGRVVKRDRINDRQFFKENLGNGILLEMVEIPAGRLFLGAADNEKGAEEDERPRAWIKIPSFFMARVPTTQAQWHVVAETLDRVNINLQTKPAKFQTKNEKPPVESVSWEEANEFCARLSKIFNLPFRLPSETEWEYACRAETNTPFAYGPTLTTQLANYNGGIAYAAERGGEFRSKTIDAGSFPPNHFGLQDMHGNVWEWCADPWHDHYRDIPKDSSVWSDGGDDTQRVLRGGSWGSSAKECRSASRFKAPMGYRGNDVGFRVVCTLV